MIDLLLIAVEKFINTPKSFIVLVIACILAMVCLNIYKKYVARTIYVDKFFEETISKYMRKMWIMFIPLHLMVHFLLYYSNYTHNSYANNPFLYMVYSLPLFILVLVQNINKLIKEDNMSMRKAILTLIPGSSFYIIFYCFLASANKSVLMLVLIAILGIMSPGILDVMIIYIVSEKSEIRVKVHVGNEKIYDIAKKDLIEGVKETTLKIRDAEGKVIQSIIMRNDKIEKKEYYNLELEKYKKK